MATDFTAFVMQSTISMRRTVKYKVPAENEKDIYDEIGKTSTSIISLTSIM